MRNPMLVLLIKDMHYLPVTVGNNETKRQHNTLIINKQTII